MKNMQNSWTFGFVVSGLAALAAAGLPACTDDSEENPKDASGGQGGTTSSAEGASGGQGETPSSVGGASGVGGSNNSGTGTSVPSLYAVTTQQTLDSTTTSYVILSSSLRGELTVESAALEIPGRALAAGPVGGETLYVGTGDSSILSRYTLTGDTLAADGTLDFLAQGIPSFTGYTAQFQFVNDTKAYWYSLTGKIVIWDPKEFIIRDSISISDIIRTNSNTGTPFNVSFTAAPIKSGSTIYSFVGWDSRDANIITMPAASALVMVDTEQDKAEVFIDERCGFRDGVISGDWLYLATEGAGTSVNYLNAANGSPPCLVRFNTKTKTFDQSFKVELNDLAGGAPTGSMLISPTGQPLLHVLDTSADGVSSITNPRLLTSAPVWKRAHLTVGDSPTLELLDVGTSSASVLPFNLRDGLRVTPTFGTNPHIYEVTDNGAAPTSKVDATVTGVVFSIVQVR